MGGKSSIQLTLLLLLIGALCLEARPQYLFYPMFDLKLNWTEARLFCQRNFTDMVGWNTASRADLTDLMRSNEVAEIWIGDHGFSMGASGNSESMASEEQVREDCVIFIDRPGQEQAYVECHEEFSFVCYEDSVVMINENKTWEDALKHCREMKPSCVDDKGNLTHCYDLLSLPDPSDYDFVMYNKLYTATTDEVWTGLRFLGGEWWWLNGETVGDHEILPECPPQWKRCGSISKYAPNHSVYRDCSERKKFMCKRLQMVTNNG